MSIRLFSCSGGTLILPDRGFVLVSRENGGNLVVNPPRIVWDFWKWGESPRFPLFAERHSYAAGCERLSAQECVAIVTKTEMTLKSHYGVCPDDIDPWACCSQCSYPTVIQPPRNCEECPA